jgi:hypothetical protein
MFFENKFDLIGMSAKDGLKEIILMGDRVLEKPSVGDSVLISTNGEGYLYIVYPFEYGLAKKIKDPNGFIIHDNDMVNLSAFTFSSAISPSIPLGYYGNYIIYQSKLPCSYIGLGKFEIIF